MTWAHQLQGEVQADQPIAAAELRHGQRRQEADLVVGDSRRDRHHAVVDHQIETSPVREHRSDDLLAVGPSLRDGPDFQAGKEIHRFFRLTPVRIRTDGQVDV